MAFSVTKRPDTGRWRARYRGPDKRQRSKDFDRKVDAERWAREQIARLDRGDWTDPALGRITVGEYAQTWLDGKHKIKLSTRVSYDIILRHHVNPTWRGTPLHAVQHEEVAAWVKRLHASGLSASKVRQAHIVLSQILDLAVRSRRIPANTARGVELPSLPGKAELPMRALDDRQLWAVAEAARWGRLSVLVLGWCGLRFGELAAMRVRSFDVLRRQMRVERSLSEVGGRLHEDTPKTAASVRTVPVPLWLVEELALLLDDKGPDDHLLTMPGGGPLRIGNWRSRVFDPAVRVAGIATQTAGDVVRPHDLRHTCASLHIKHGTPPKVLSEMLGHASVSITLDRYGHLYPGDMAQYVDQLGHIAMRSREEYRAASGGASVVLLGSP